MEKEEDRKVVEFAQLGSLQQYLRDEYGISVLLPFHRRQLKARLDETNHQLGQVTRPQGSRSNPAPSCRDLMHMQGKENVQDGMW